MAGDVEPDLKSVLKSQLRENVADVFLDRRLADRERLGDLLVGASVGDQLRHLELTVGEMGRSFGSSPRQRVPENGRRGPRLEPALTGGHGAYGQEEVLGTGAAPDGSGCALED